MTSGRSSETGSEEELINSPPSLLLVQHVGTFSKKPEVDDYSSFSSVLSPVSNVLNMEEREPESLTVTREIIK